MYIFHAHVREWLNYLITRWNPAANGIDWITSGFAKGWSRFNKNHPATLSCWSEIMQIRSDRVECWSEMRPRVKSAELLLFIALGAIRSKARDDSRTKRISVAFFYASAVRLRNGGDPFRYETRSYWTSDFSPFRKSGRGPEGSETSRER